MKTLLILPSLLLFLLSSCSDAPSPKSNKVVADTLAPTNSKASPESQKPAPIPVGPTNEITYHFISYRNKNDSLRDSAKAFINRLNAAELDIVYRINRVDSRTLRRLDTIVIPNLFDTNSLAYSIFPAQIPMLNEVHKMLIFSYFHEAFGAYENGILVRTGPTSMGKKLTKTDTGLFFTNWKAKQTISTIDDSWILKWNFNISNHGGIGFHEYELPGYPASHSCLRLLEADAKFLYSWANQWILSKNTLIASGTPVLVYGAYPFGQGKTWWHLVTDPHSFQIQEDALNPILQFHLDKILTAQQRRDSVVAELERQKTLASGT